MSVSNSTSSGTTSVNRIPGLASGFDTQSIVDSLMALERKPLEKLTIQKQTEQVKLQAYQAVNSLLLNFRNSISNLASRKLWNAKTTVSSNEKSLTATANEYAVKGSYNFRVAKLATATQYMTKGFADQKAPLVAQKEGEEAYKLGTININSAKTRVDNSAKVDDLNGGKGIFRGSVRITDGANNTSIIDLSACDTVDDVVRALNDSDKALIKASIVDGTIQVEDTSRGGSGSLRIQNVGTGTTATDLGIAGETEGDSKVIKGYNVYTLGEDMSLSILNDGLGVEQGKFVFRVSSNTGYVRLDIDLDNCKSVGDVIKRINDTIIEKEDSEEFCDYGGEQYKKVLNGLRFGISEDKTSFSLTGITANNSYEFYEDPYNLYVSNAESAQQLGLTGLKKAQEGELEVTFGKVLGAMDSPMLKNLGGVNGQKIGETTKVQVPFSGDTKLNTLNGGKGLDPSRPLQFLLTEAGGADVVARAEILDFNDILDHTELQKIYNGEGDYDGTVSELVSFINTSIDKYARDPKNGAAGLIGVSVEMDPTEARLNLVGGQGAYKIEVLGSMASALGLIRTDVKSSEDSDEWAIKSALDGYTDNKEAIDYFYGLNKHYNSLLPDDMVDINLDPDKKDSKGEPVPLTTLKDLVGLHGVTQDDGESDEDYTARVETALKNLFGSENGSFAIKSREKVALSTGELPFEREVTINWKDIAVVDEEGKPKDPPRTFADLDFADIDIATFTRSVNAAVQAGFDAEVPQLKDKMKAVIDGTEGMTADEKTALKAEIDTIDEETLKTSAPQMAVHHLGTGFRWTNMNFNAEWDMSGDALEKMALSKNTYQYKDDGTENFVENENYIETMATSYIKFNANPMETGYYVMEDITNDTKLSELSFGVGMTLTGQSDDDTIDFLFDSIKETVDGKEVDKKVGVSISLREIKEALLSEDNGGLGYETTVEKYAEIMNNLLQAKMDEYNTANNSEFKMEFGFDEENDKFVLKNLENIKAFDIDGAAATVDCTGITRMYVTAEDMEKLGADHEYGLGQLYSASVHQNTIEGLGDITFTAGNSDQLYRLVTGGTMKYADGTEVLDADGNAIEINLDQNSTLNDVLAVLNEQIQYFADETKGGNAALKSVRFTLNTSGTGIAVDNSSALRLTFKDTVDEEIDPDTGEVTRSTSDANMLGQALGLVNADNSDLRVESRSFYNCSSVGRNWISRATSLEQFVGKNAELGTISLTNAYGDTFGIALDGCLTIGDVLDAINDGKEQHCLEAIINEAGTGITIKEYYDFDPYPVPTKNIVVADTGTTSTAKKLGFAGEGKRADADSDSVIEGTLGVSIDVMSSDSLESIMYRIAENGNYKAAIINDGKSTNPYRLTIASANTGEANDFVLDGDLAELLGFTQTSRGSDGKVLYGDPNSSASPVMLSSSTNTNSNAILGLTLDLKATSTEWTTLTIDDDKERVAEEIKGMVESYNALTEIISYLAADDEETGEPGIFAGDSVVKSLMDDIDEFFYMVYNPNNVAIGQPDADGNQQTWTWMDIGVTLSAANSNADGSGTWFSTMELDEDALSDFIANHWDVMSKMLSSEENVSNVNRDVNVRPTGSFNGELEAGFSEDGAINGDMSKGGWGAANGVMAKDTIENGANEYTIWFQKPITMARMSIYHYSSETALKNYTIEYMDEKGQWQTYREVNDNSSDANYFGVATPNVQAIRIKADSTNAEDGKFRLLDVQIFEQGGLAGQLNSHTTELGDTQFGFLAQQNESITNSISDLDDQLSKLQDRLDAKEEQLWRKFSNMETILSQLKNQGDYFETMMGSMNGSSSK
ncbi:MAG: flagellar filament capping protein FliD [Planctomycetaceae bacterium]|nr:flagellar filament capping protein FliD [Planctomycetaceae bacterium]